MNNSYISAATWKPALAVFVVLTMSAAGAATSSDESAEQWQSLDSIRRAAEKHAAGTVSVSSASTQVAAARLDDRLKLPACSAPLRTETPWSASRGSRVTVRVSCDTETPWRVHVPVEVVVVGSVVTSTRALARGTVLTRADVAVTRQPLGPLGHGFFADPANVVGQKLKRPLSPGSVLLPSQLEAPSVISRGQNVTIVANATGIAVKMNGTALQDGAVGQVIDIENRSSGKRIQGVVRSAGAVEILLR